MRTFRLALVQHASPVGQKAANLEATIQWTRRAKEQGPALVCFPELGITGHAGHARMVAEAEPVPDGDAVRSLVDLARDLDLFICAGIAEDGRGIHYNTQFIVGPEGYLGKQRKVHLSADEYFFFRGGTKLPVLDLPFARVGIIICYDNNFPEVARCLAVDGAELILAPHAARFGAWPEDEEGRRQAVRRVKENWRMVHSCRAYDNGVYAAVCNTAGRSALDIEGVEANHAGGCLVVDPKGQVVAESSSEDIAEELLVVELDGDLVAERRRQACFNLQTRRPEVFGALVRPTD